MADLTKTLCSPTFWVASVIVGTIIAVLATYIRDGIDWTASKLSANSREQSEKFREFRASEVQYLKENPQEMLFLGMQELRARLRAMVGSINAIGLMIVSTFCFNNNSPVSGIIGLLLMAFSCAYSLAYIKHAISLEKLLHEARQSKYEDYL